MEVCLAICEETSVPPPTAVLVCLRADAASACFWARLPLMSSQCLVRPSQAWTGNNFELLKMDFAFIYITRPRGSCLCRPRPPARSVRVIMTYVPWCLPQNQYHHYISSNNVASSFPSCSLAVCDFPVCCQDAVSSLKIYWNKFSMNGF